MEHRHALVEPFDMARSRFRTLVQWVVGPTLHPTAGARRLVVCARCASDVVNPVRWNESDETHWWIRLRCGNCGHVCEVIASDEEAQRLDRDLQAGITKIAATAIRLERQRMRADLVTLTQAFERDLIAPDDFVT